MKIEEELKRLQEKNSKPKEADLGLPRFGTVVDNRDPQCLGRVRVSADTIAPGAITPWIPVIALGAGKGFGWWQIPDIGSQVLMAFVGRGHSNPVVLGNIYDLKNRPPEPSTKNPADSKLYQTKNHRMEFIDEEGRESLIISTAKGKMRMVLDKKKGIELINELGDIKIRCRKLRISGDKGVDIVGEKKVKIQSEEKAAIKASKGIKAESDKEVKIKGQCVKFEASKGITTEGKQLAAEGDKVMGFDVHQMVVPAGTSTAIVPLPHPFLGKLADKLSKDVKIKGHNAATKGSIAKHDDATHNQLPGTIRFNQNPRKEGEVTGGTGRKLKINGKEAAVIGSTVTTCNDVGARENSVILAVGASIPMPVIINPKNTDKWKEEQESEKTREAEFTDARWVKSRVKEGELAELTARVKDIADGNMVTFQVWRKGQDPNAHESYYRLPAPVENGAAKAQWKYRQEREDIPEEDPEYYFTVHSAWCSPKRSGDITVELKRPEILEMKYRDKEGKEISEALVDDEIILYCKVKDIEDGERVSLRIFEQGEGRDRIVANLSGEVKDGKVEMPWPVICIKGRGSLVAKEIREQGWSVPKYYIVAEYGRAESKQSGLLEIKGWIKRQIKDKDTDEIIADRKYTIIKPNGTIIEGTTDKEGNIDATAEIAKDGYIFLHEELECPDSKAHNSLKNFMEKLLEKNDLGVAKNHKMPMYRLAEWLEKRNICALTDNIEAVLLHDGIVVPENKNALLKIIVDPIPMLETGVSHITVGVKSILPYLFIIGAVYGITIWKNSEIARERAIKEFPQDSLAGGQLDAFRHSLWHALNLQDVPAGISRMAGDAIEFTANKTSFLQADVHMDIHNNEVGIEIGKSNRNAGLQELVDLIHQQINQGNLLVLRRKPRDGSSIYFFNRLYRSNDMDYVNSIGFDDNFIKRRRAAQRIVNKLNFLRRTPEQVAEKSRIVDISEVIT